MRNRAVDRVAWRCTDHRCRHVTSIRAGSFFEASHLELWQLAIIVYHVSQRTPIYQLVREAEISQKTAIDWANFIREVMSEDVDRHPRLLGGANGPVSIDECCVSKAKPARNRRARRVPEVWVFGLSDPTGEVHMEVVPDRTAQTLIPIIVRHVAPGSMVWSDGWAAYAHGALGRAGFGHQVVIHEREFVRADGMNINRAEGNWSNMKARFKGMKGTSRALLPSYLREFMWTARHRRAEFTELVRAMREQYPV